MMNSQQHELSFTDKELVRGCLEKNRLMQRALYERYSTQLNTLIYRLISNRSSSEDILQDAFIEIFRSLAGFRFESSLYSWMRTIAVRNALAFLKKNARMQFTTNELPDLPSDTSYSFTAGDLEKAILSLPEQARSVFILIEVEGYNHKEVAEMLCIHEGTSKSQLNYAKKLLRKRLIIHSDE